MNDPIETLSQIRTMMERSSRFISLSGLSGIFVGIYALAGGGIIWFYGEFMSLSAYNPLAYELHNGGVFPWYTIIVAVLILVAAVTTAVYFTSRNTRKKGLPLWDHTSRRFLLNLFLPLGAGGFFALVLILKGYLELVVPVTLIFYGLALLNGSKYAYDEIRYLAFCEIGVGLIASCFTGYGLVFWALGFGIFHIFYGIKMYYKYEQ